MGIEFNITVTPWSAWRIERILRPLPEFAGVDPQFGHLQFRSRAVADPASMPDAHASIQQDHLYFCNSGGDGAQILRGILKVLGERSSNVICEEL
jgi:hypothetical protein